MKVHELLHRIKFDDNARNAVVIVTDYHSYPYEIFVFVEQDNDWFRIFGYLEEDVKKYTDDFRLVGTKDMYHELRIYLSVRSF